MVGPRVFRRACERGKTTPVPSLLLWAALPEARGVTDQAGNVGIAKGAEGGLRMRAEDDALATAIPGVAAGTRHEAAEAAGMKIWGRGASRHRANSRLKRYPIV